MFIGGTITRSQFPALRADFVVAIGVGFIALSGNCACARPIDVGWQPVISAWPPPAPSRGATRQVHGAVRSVALGLVGDDASNIGIRPPPEVTGVNTALHLEAIERRQTAEERDRFFRLSLDMFAPSFN